MTIELSDTRLPGGFNGEDLGQSASAPGEEILLISYQSSPIVIDYVQTYVLFVLNPATAARISAVSWEAWLTYVPEGTEIDLDITMISATSVQLTVVETGNLTIMATVSMTDGTSTSVIMTQKVITSFFEQEPSVDEIYCSWATPATTRSIFDNYFSYLVGLNNDENHSFAELRFLVASILYHHLLFSDNDPPLFAATDDLNYSNADFLEGGGIVRLRPQLLLYLFSTDTGTDTAAIYEALISYDPTDVFEDNTMSMFKTLYDTLSTDQKIDFYNLLRFPKAQLTICKDYLVFLNRMFHPTNTIKETFDTEETRQELLRQYYCGPYNTEDDLSETSPFYDKLSSTLVSQMESLMPDLGFLKRMLYAERYGPYKLQRDDSDTTLVFEGATHALEDIPFTVNDNGHTGTPNFIRNLKSDLYALGFDLFTSTERTSAVFDRHTEWAVKEFQIYASLNYTARIRSSVGLSIADNLETVANTLQYTGPKTGVLNQETAVIMQYWLDNNYHCPVVISRFDQTGSARSTLFADNVWLYDTPGHVYVRDLSNFYQGYSADCDTRLPNWIELSHHASYSGWDGPVINQVESWSSCAIGFDDFTGIARDAADTTQAVLVSTFKVIQSVAKAEVGSKYDIMNCYDSGIVSWGVPHWTLHSGGQGNELGATFYFIKQILPATFDRGLKTFGIVDADHSYNSTYMKYTGSIYVENEEGEHVIPDYSAAEISYYKCLHPLYRFIMMVRAFPEVKVFMWNFLRKRLSDVLDKEIGPGVNQIGTTTPARVRDVYTSERSIAIIFRWHVNSPRTLDSGGRLANVLKGTGTSPTSDDLSASYNTDDSQAKLADRWMEQALNHSNTSITAFPATVNAYRYETIALLTTHNSFQFYDTDIPSFT